MLNFENENADLLITCEHSLIKVLPTEKGCTKTIF